MRRGLWMCRFRLDNFRAPKCIPATQVLNQMLCPSVFREKLKKKKKWPTEFIGFNFLCRKMSCVVFMPVVSKAGVPAVGREGMTIGECLRYTAVSSSLPKADFRFYIRLPKSPTASCWLLETAVKKHSPYPPRAHS